MEASAGQSVVVEHEAQLPPAATGAPERRRGGVRYRSVHDWVEDCRALVRADWDNVILFTGEPGAGKSTVALQILRALDGSFDVERVHMTIPDFLRGARRTPKYGAVLADEFLANRRKAMTSELIEVNDFLQICRGLNLHMGICFPEGGRLDLAIFEDRVRWRVHVPRRGVFVLTQRVVRTTKKRGGEEVTRVLWVHRGTFSFRANAGTLWDRYSAMKEAHMRNRGVDVAAQKIAEEPELGWDWNALRDTFRRILEKARAEEAPAAEIRSKSS